MFAAGQKKNQRDLHTALRRAEQTKNKKNTEEERRVSGRRSNYFIFTIEKEGGVKKKLNEHGR